MVIHESIREVKASPWASFCMSTYRRPDFLAKQLSLLLTQTFANFEIVVSDNDPDGSAEKVINAVNDRRIKYFRNGSNIGMIGSFNKTIERANGEFIIMVTDDDPVTPEFLSEMAGLVKQDNSYAIYGGFLFSGRNHDDKVIIPADKFIEKILDPSYTLWMLWSSCVIRREILMINKIPDYKSPHLADHAMIALAGSNGGGLFLNNKFSSLTSHESNFSKFNFEYYVQGCKGFYNAFATAMNSARNLKAVRKHLHHWFIANYFNLKRYYTVVVPDQKMLAEVQKFANEILDLEFMQGCKFKYELKNVIFALKKALGLLKRK